MFKVYTIYDRITGEHSPPLLAKNDTAAFRLFKANVNKYPQPEDFVLYTIGTYNSEAKNNENPFDPYIYVIEVHGEDDKITDLTDVK